MKRLYISRRIKYMLGGYKSKRNKYKKSFSLISLYIIIFSVIIIFILIRCGARLCDFALLMGKDRLKNDITNNCSIIVSSLLSEHGSTYESMVTAQSGEDGKINSISTDFYKINLFKNSLEEELANYLDSYNRTVCKVPIGAILFDDIYTAWGVKIPTFLLTSSSVSVEFLDEFTTAGINQTKHTLMLKATVNSKIHTVLKSTDVEIKLDIPVIETIIVDEVPNFILPSAASEN